MVLLRTYIQCSRQMIRIHSWYAVFSFKDQYHFFFYSLATGHAPGTHVLLLYSIRMDRLPLWMNVAESYSPVQFCFLVLLSCFAFGLRRVFSFRNFCPLRIVMTVFICRESYRITFAWFLVRLFACESFSWKHNFVFSFCCCVDEYLEYIVCSSWSTSSTHDFILLSSNLQIDFSLISWRDTRGGSSEAYFNSWLKNNNRTRSYPRTGCELPLHKHP